MSFKEDQLDGVKVLRFNGRIDTANAPGIEQQVRNLIEAGAKSMVFDCSGIVYISSAGLRFFLIAAKQLHAQSGRFAVCGAQGHVKEVLNMAGLPAVLAIYEHETEAVDHCRRGLA
jgi:anti-sigma B factor antagonist